MEVAQSSADLDNSKRTSHHFSDIVSNDPPFTEVTDKDLLRLFEYNEESLRYYLGLKEAVIASWRKGELCWCDPRDVQMKERLMVSGWMPRVVCKLPLEQQGGCEPGGAEYSNKQVALDELGSGEAVAGADTPQEADDGDDDGDGMKMEPDSKSFACGLGGCKQTFTALAGYESHYHTCHNYVCTTCRSSFVSAFLLDVHLEENHDSYFQVLSPRVDMFRCLVESCKLKFRTPDLRKDHLIKAHQLPANFMFHKPVKTKSKKIKATAKPQSTATTSSTESHKMDTSHETSSSSADCDAGEHSLPSVVKRTQNNRRDQKVPQAVCFGRGSQKAFSRHRPGGRRPHWHQVASADMDTAVDIEKVDFTDMADSLECS